MRAHRIKVRVSEDHELRVTLPSDVPPGEAEVIVLGGEQGDAGRGSKLTVDEFLAARLSRPAGVDPVALADMDKAIADGANGRGCV